MTSIEKGSLYVFSSRVVFFITGYILYIILGRFVLSPAQFGTFGVVLGLLAVTNAVLMLGIRQAVSRFVSVKKEAAQTIKAKAFRLQLVLSTAVFIFYLAASPFLANIFNEPDMVVFVPVAALSVFFQPLLEVIRGYLNGLKKFKEDSLLGIFTRILRLVLPLTFFAIGFSLFGVFLGIALAALVPLAFGFASTGSSKHENKNSFRTKTLLIFALPVFAFAFTQNFIMQVDVFFVKGLLQASDAGFYVAATTLARLPTEAILTITFVLFPLVSETTFSKAMQKARFYVMHSFRYLFLFILPVSFAVSVTAQPLMAAIYGGEYVPGSESLAILALAYIFFALFSISATILVASGNAKRTFAVGLFALLLDIVLNYLLVPLYGMPGAAIATLVSMFAAAVISTVLVFAKFKTFPLKSVLKAVVAVAVMLFASSFFPAQGILLVVKYLVMIAVYLFVLFALREIKETDFEVLKNAFS